MVRELEPHRRAGQPASRPATSQISSAHARGPGGGLAAVFTAVTAAVFLGETLLLGGRAEDLRPLAVPEDRHVAASQNLERLLHSFQMIELCRTGLGESPKHAGL